jgi:1,4-dihydroxy-2-naphthoyl-CoA hydrolase
MPLPDQPPFAHFLGIKLVSVTPDRVQAELAVREEFKNRGGVCMAAR